MLLALDGGTRKIRVGTATANLFQVLGVEGDMYLLARVTTGPSEALAGIRSALRAVDAEVPIIQEASLSSFVCGVCS